MRAKGIDYFENSRCATYIQRAHAIRNPEGLLGFHENCWGVTASDGLGPADFWAERGYDWYAGH